MGLKGRNENVARIGRGAVRSRRRMPGCFGARRLTAFAACAAFGGILMSAPVANADATRYTEGLGCIRILVGQHVQNNTGLPLLQGLLDDSAPPVSGGAYVQVPRPASVYAYRGTANLFWAPYVKIVRNSTGRSAAAQLKGYGVYPWRAVWQVSNGWFTNIWWNAQSPQTNAQFYISPGFTAYVWSATYWLNRNGAWFYRQYHYEGSCQA
jgi:hypothetical protein